MLMGRLNAKEFAFANAGFVSNSSSDCSFNAVVGSLLRDVVVVFTVVDTVVRGRMVVVPVTNNGSRSVVAVFGAGPQPCSPGIS